MCFGQRLTERVSAKPDITVLGEASSQDTLKPANHWVLCREFFYDLNPKCNFVCCVLARSNIHTVCWTSKCGYIRSTSVLSYSSISCWSSQLKKKKKKWFLFRSFLRKHVNNYFFLQKQLKNLSSKHHHLILYCSWPKTCPCTLQKQSP